MTEKVLDGPGTDVPAYSPVCSYCRHLRWDQERACDAFPAPGAIPLDIWLGRLNHREPYPGDHGVQFEPIGAEEAHRRGAAAMRATPPPATKTTKSR